MILRRPFLQNQVWLIAKTLLFGLKISRSQTERF